MMKIKLVCLSLLVLSMFPGCKSVVSDHLIGEPLGAEEAKAYEGVWRINDGVMHIKHVEGGDLIAAGVEWKDDHFEVNELHTTVTVLGDMRIAQIVSEEEEEGELDLGPAEPGEEAKKQRPWVLVGMVNASGDDSLVIYGPNFDRFEQALRSGELAGEVDEEGNTMHIQGDKAALDAFISGEPLTELFRVQNPQVMTRIGSAD